jgi:hypothetical protein
MKTYEISECDGESLGQALDNSKLSETEKKICIVAFQEILRGAIQEYLNE